MAIRAKVDLDDIDARHLLTGNKGQRAFTVKPDLSRTWHRGKVHSHGGSFSALQLTYRARHVNDDNAALAPQRDPKLLAVAAECGLMGLAANQ